MGQTLTRCPGAPIQKCKPRPFFFCFSVMDRILLLLLHGLSSTHLQGYGEEEVNRVHKCYFPFLSHVLSPPFTHELTHNFGTISPNSLVCLFHSFIPEFFLELINQSKITPPHIPNVIANLTHSLKLCGCPVCNLANLSISCCCPELLNAAIHFCMQFSYLSSNGSMPSMRSIAHLAEDTQNKSWNNL